MNKKTHEEYVKELAIKNPNVEVIEKYINANTKIMHRCLIHDICWRTTPSRALQGVGCEKCHTERFSQSRTCSHEEYIEQLKRVNPNIIPLEKYKTIREPILHYCKTHNIEWTVMPDNVLRGHGCRECGKEKIGDKNTKPYDQYQEELNSKFPTIKCIGNYKNFTTSVLHKCMVCNYEWSPVPVDLLKGVGCPRCTHHLKRDEEYYVEELKRINPQIELIGNFINMNTPILHRCKIHDHYWNVIPSSIVSGTGCPLCGKEKSALSRKKTSEYFKNELKIVNPDVICIGEYYNSKTKIKVKCLKCGHIWEALPSNLLRGSGCPKCNKSNGETTIYNWLINNDIDFIPQKKFDGCKDKRLLPFDFYIPSKNIAIEYDGKQHSQPIDWFGGLEGFKYIKRHDQIKTQYCKNNDIKLFRITYEDNIQEKLNSLFI